MSDELIEYGFCGSLGWTVEQWGRVTHKHACPNRADPWCQSHPDNCPSAVPELQALAAEKMQEALNG